MSIRLPQSFLSGWKPLMLWVRARIIAPPYRYRVCVCPTKRFYRKCAINCLMLALLHRCVTCHFWCLISVLICVHWTADVGNLKKYLQTRMLGTLKICSIFGIDGVVSRTQWPITRMEGLSSWKAWPPSEFTERTLLVGVVAVLEACQHIICISYLYFDVCASI